MSATISQNDFDEAYAQAQASFLAGIPFRLTFRAEEATGVTSRRVKRESRLNINFESPVVRLLQSHGASQKEAWLMVLAHEAGHLKLNHACFSQSKNPESSDDQLEIIGLDWSARGLVAEFQKETAIEAYCDALLAQHACETMGNRGLNFIQVLSDHRERQSKNLGLFEPDDFATSPALRAILKKGAPLPPIEAARIALDYSMEKTPAIKKIAVSAVLMGTVATENFKKKLAKWRHQIDGQEREPPSSGPK